MSAEQPSIQFHEAAGVFAPETRAPAGWKLEQHVHEHDHLSVLASGRVRLTVDDVSREIEGPAVLTIKAHQRHSIESLTPVVWLCLWGSDYGMQDAARESLKLVEA